MTSLDAQSRHAAEITRRSRSNFALAFVTLPRERREAMVTYYAFCRVVDDIVDEPGPSREERLAQLDRWRRVVDGRGGDLSAFERDVVGVQDRYDIPAAELHLLIDGMAMDLDTVRYETIEATLRYCYHVASSVGFVCMRLCGCDVPKTLEYAENLGYCLQLTNIIRDVGEDWRNDRRIYIPREDLERFDLSEAAFEDPSSAGGRFEEMLAFQYDRAVGYYDRAARSLPREEKRRLIPMEIMLDTYRAILEKIRADSFRVFENRYRLGRLDKLGILTRRIFAGLV